MQLDWTTFILEIVNFMVLVWILQRFLYRPVLDILAERQRTLAEANQKAQSMRDEAEALRLQYESRLADWQKECDCNRRQLSDELALIKTEEMERIKLALANEEEKMQVRNETLLAARETELRRALTDQAYAETAAMLRRLAEPELTERIAEVFLEDLEALPENERQVLRKAGEELKEPVLAIVGTAHALSDRVESDIAQGLQAAVGIPLAISFQEDSSLIAGLRASVGECQLDANLADELAFFRRSGNHGRE